MEEGKTNNEITIIEGVQLSAQSSLSIFAQKYFHKCKDNYFILQNKYFCIYEDSFGAKILRDDCALSITYFKGAFNRD